jgi:hypothetical protein
MRAAVSQNVPGRHGMNADTDVRDSRGPRRDEDDDDRLLYPKGMECSQSSR